MGDAHNTTAPPPPWFWVPKLPHVSRVTTQDENDQTINLPFIQYTLLDKEPMMMGTTANNAPVYGNTLKALPAPPPPFESVHVPTLVNFITVLLGVWSVIQDS